MFQRLHLQWQMPTPSQLSSEGVKIGQVNASTCLFPSEIKSGRLECAQYESIARNKPTTLAESETIFKGSWISHSRWVQTASSTCWSGEKKVLTDYPDQGCLLGLWWAISKISTCPWDGRRLGNFCNHKFSLHEKIPKLTSWILFLQQESAKEIWKFTEFYITLQKLLVNWG